MPARRTSPVGVRKGLLAWSQDPERPEVIMRSANRPLLWLLGAMTGMTLGFAPPAGAETYVTTYVTKVQEERESTRWTLTEWLRIKERMRMMDLWLAMFSDPKKDQFRPELNLSYGVTRGQLSLTDGASSVQIGASAGVQGRAQLWLTNLISGTVGIRTLNIDLGGEAYQRTTGGSLVSQVATEGSSAAVVPARSSKNTYYAGTLRLFGKNVQDSSLVLKYGEYVTDNMIPNWADAESESHKRGRMAGGELNVYLLKWLGAEGNYIAYGDSASVGGSDALKGSYYDYTGFVEVSLLRLMVGRYQEDWTFSSLDQQTELKESGLVFGGKLSF